MVNPTDAIIYQVSPDDMEKLNTLVDMSEDDLFSYFVRTEPSEVPRKNQVVCLFKRKVEALVPSVKIICNDPAKSGNKRKRNMKIHLRNHVTTLLKKLHGIYLRAHCLL